MSNKISLHFYHESLLDYTIYTLLSDIIFTLRYKGGHMRPIKLLGSFMLLLYLPLYAQEVQPTTPLEEPLLVQETTPPPAKVDEVIAVPKAELSKIETLIKSVQTAPDKQKRVLMNQLKTELKTMNQESRHQAMMKLKHSFAKKKEEGVAHQQKQKHTNQKIYHQGNHQPKFRHLRKGARDGRGNGNGQK